MVKTPKGLDLFSVYLDDLSEDTRLEQTKSLLETVRAGLPTVIMGDLNTVDESEAAEVESRARKLYARLPMLEGVMGKVATEMMRGEVTQKIKGGGFTDLGKGKGETYPTKLSPLPADQPLARVDYVFGKGVTVEEVWVLRGNDFDSLSDHYPILIRLSL